MTFALLGEGRSTAQARNWWQTRHGRHEEMSLIAKSLNMRLVGSAYHNSTIAGTYVCRSSCQLDVEYTLALNYISNTSMQ